MRVFSLLLFTIVLLIIPIEITAQSHQDDILLGSGRFVVKGSTSVGSFDCVYKTETKDTLFIGKTKGLSQKIAVKDFKCGNFVLNHDFRKTLKHKEFPEVEFSLYQIYKAEAGYRFKARFIIAGKEKTFSDLLLEHKDKELKSEVNLQFSDFELTPPQKLGGAIKVEEEIGLFIQLQIQ